MEKKSLGKTLIIVGVVLLVLFITLLLLRGLFTPKVGTLSEDAFSDVEGFAPFDPTRSDLTVSLSGIELSQGSSELVRVFVANLGETAARFQLKSEIVGETADKAKFACDFASSQTSESEFMVLDPEQYEIEDVVVHDDKDPTPRGSYVCKISLEKDDIVISEEAIIVKVVP